MLILEIVLFGAALIAIALLAVHQIVTQVREYRFYKRNGRDFSVDSGLDKIDKRIVHYDLKMTNWQRLYLFRPFFILMLIAFMTMMIASSF